MKQLLLLSSSRIHGHGYLEYCKDEIIDFIDDAKVVLFVPYALADWDQYAAIARAFFQDQLGLTFTSIHEHNDKKQAVDQAEVIFVGGGNTFRLLKRLYDEGLIPVIRGAVESGRLRYMGASAGTNVATRSIKTTNDMPIVYPPSFDALQLVPFNVNPHYFDPVQGSTHMGETREQRIKEFHEENNQVVIGLREGSWLRVMGDEMTLKGYSARVFQKNADPEEFMPDQDLSDFLHEYV